MATNKMSKDIIPEGFTMSLVLVDAIPVLFFGGNMILMSILLNSPLFLIGAILCLYAGVAKVLWKMIVVRKRQNIWWMFLQMRIVMPVGMLLMLAGIFVNKSHITIEIVKAAVFSGPQSIFFLIGVIGMCLMIVFAVKLDSADAKSNWIEQLTNGIAQACFFIGLLLLV